MPYVVEPLIVRKWMKGVWVELGNECDKIREGTGSS